MNNNYVTINLGVNMNNKITVQQYTSGMNLVFIVEDYSPPYDSTIALYAKKPSGHEVLYGCNFDGNNITVPCTLQMTAEVGITHGQIQIYQDGTFLYSYSFRIEVLENEYAAMKIESSDDYKYLVEIVDTAGAILENIKSAEETRIANETKRQANEEEREALNDKYDTEEAKRVANETEREQNEQDRKDAETLREEAENGENGRVANEELRKAAFENWSDIINDYDNIKTAFENYTAATEDGKDKYVPLNSNSITRGTRNADGTYSDYCKITYNKNKGGLIFTFG